METDRSTNDPAATTAGLDFCLAHEIAPIVEKHDDWHSVDMRDHILSEIRKLATANGGQAPGQTLFARETGIAAHEWRGKHWARWGDALIDAGLQPNEWTGKLDSEKVLDGIIAGVRHFGRFPTKDELMLFRKTEPSIPSDQAIRRHFGTRNDLITALAERAATNPLYADITTMLPAVVEKPKQVMIGKPADGFVYLIKSGEHYKVGRSDDAERRFKQISITLPDKAVLFHTIRTDDPPGIEAYWHRRFAAKRANGEWFKLSAMDVSAFKRRKFQ